MNQSVRSTYLSQTNQYTGGYGGGGSGYGYARR